MSLHNILDVQDRHSFRLWLQEHAGAETECWIVVKRGRPADPDVFYYLDAVEDARMGIGMVAMAGRNIEVAYIREISQMYEGMRMEVLEKAHRRLSGMKNGTLQLRDLEG